MALFSVLSLAALSALPAPIVSATSTSAALQATASVRIVAGARIQLQGSNGADLPKPRDAVVHTDGAVRTVSLIEFQ